VVGSGAETIAHLRENGRVVVMLCAFEGPPRILRLHGRGEVVTPAQLAGEARRLGVGAPVDEHRQEVEALLAHARTADGFLAAPINAVAAHVLGEATGAFVGRQISSYRILAHLGAGGMDI